MKNVPYGSKPKPPKPKKERSIWTMAEDAVKSVIGAVESAADENAAQQKELAPIRVLNAEYSRRKESSDYMWFRVFCIGATLAVTAAITVAINPDNWMTYVLIGGLVLTGVLAVVSTFAMVVEDKLIKRDMKRDGWPIPPK